MVVAEDLIQQSKKALLKPFNLEDCLKIADSQLAGARLECCFSRILIQSWT